MSRTYRRSQVKLDCNCGAPILTEEVVALLSGEEKKPGSRIFYIDGVIHYWWNSSANQNARYFRYGLPPDRACNCGVRYDNYTKRNYKRDRKPWYKAPKWFRKIKTRETRAKINSKMAQGRYDDIPIFRNGIIRDWS